MWTLTRDGVDVNDAGLGAVRTGIETLAGYFDFGRTDARRTVVNFARPCGKRDPVTPSLFQTARRAKLRVSMVPRDSVALQLAHDLDDARAASLVAANDSLLVFVGLTLVDRRRAVFVPGHAACAAVSRTGMEQGRDQDREQGADARRHGDPRSNWVLRFGLEVLEREVGTP